MENDHRSVMYGLTEVDWLKMKIKQLTAKLESHKDPEEETDVLSEEGIELLGFIEKIENPASMCVLHDDAVNAADLIRMWRGTAVTLYSAILESAGAEGMDAFEWALQEEQKIIRSQSYQGAKK